MTRDFYCLIIYTSDKIFLERTTLAGLDTIRRKRKDVIAYFRLFDAPGGAGASTDIFYQLLVEARRDGFPVKHCSLCKYHGPNWNAWQESRIYCRFLKKPCGPNEAATCSYFRTPPKESQT